MKVLVTGGTGFIGSHMAELLVARGCDVVCPVRDISTLRHLDGISVRVIALDKLEQELAPATGFDYVIHLAAATRARDYEGYRAGNVELTRRLLEFFAGSQAAIDRVVGYRGTAVGCGSLPGEGNVLITAHGLQILRRAGD